LLQAGKQIDLGSPTGDARQPSNIRFQEHDLIGPVGNLSKAQLELRAYQIPHDRYRLAQWRVLPRPQVEQARCSLCFSHRRYRVRCIINKQEIPLLLASGQWWHFGP
jgi:hypothetical protein